MGAASSSSSVLQLTPLRSEGASQGGTVESPWSLPSSCQDDIWLKVDLSMLVGTGAGLAGKGGGDFSRVFGERRREGIGRDQAPRSSLLGPSHEGFGDVEEDWLAAILCLSTSSLAQEDMALLVARAKNRLLEILSYLCCQKDDFHEAVMQRVHVLKCVHAAMSRRRRAQFERKPGGPATAPHNSVAAQPGPIDLSSAASGDDFLGLRLFFSLLEFVRDPDCGQEQLADFLRQISPVLTNLPPLCLANDFSGSHTNPHTGKEQPTQQPFSVGVVDSLREFLAVLAIPGKANHVKGEHDSCPERETGTAGLEERSVALAAMVSLVAARGRASDLLTLVKVLLSIPCQGADVVEVLQDESEPNGHPSSTNKNAAAECCAKR